MAGKRLSTEAIRALIEADEWPAIEYVNHTGDAAGDKALLIEATRFLESFDPGRKWSAQQFMNLIDNHLSDRYYSGEELGRTVAKEDREDGSLSELGYAVISRDGDWRGYVSRKPGNHVWDATDKPGTVLFFHHLWYAFELGED